MNSAHRLSAILMGTTVMVAQPFTWGKAIAGVSIGKLAPEVTVFIQGVNNPDNFGSGVIIGHSGNNYTVLTAGHVVEAADQYTIQVNDGIQYTLKKIRRFPNIDLAEVQFESSSTYSVAQLGNSDQVSLTTGVYVVGYPKPGQNIRIPVLTITNGEIAQVLPANASVDGYGFAYTNSTRAGMSGGPVFNDTGEVVAIHGRKEGEANGGATNGAWLNLGIPINRYKSAGSSSQIASVSNIDLTRKAQEQAQRQAALEAQRKAQEQAQQQAALEAQRKAQEQAALEAQRKAQEQAALEAQRKAQEQAQRQAALEAQRKAQEQAQQQAALEAQRKAQEQAALEAQRKAQEQAALEAQRKAQEQAALEAQRKAQEQAALEAQRKAQEQAALEAQRKAQEQAQRQGQQATATKTLLASTSPFVASGLQPQAATSTSSREVCKDVRINTIVVKRCSTEAVPIQESASASPTNGTESYVNSGNASATNGNYQSAVSDYTSAIQENGSLGIAFFNRGLAYYNLGQKDKAIADFTKAADLFRSQGDAQKLRKTQDILQALTQSNS